MLLSLHEFREMVERALPRHAEHVRVAVPGVPWYDAELSTLRFDGDADVEDMFETYENLEEYFEQEIQVGLEQERAAAAAEEPRELLKIERGTRSATEER